MALARLKVRELSPEQLMDLRSLIDENLDEEEPEENQQNETADNDSSSADDVGYIEEKYIPRLLKNGTRKLFGPYRYRVTMVDGKKKRKYLGKVRK